MRCCEVEQGSHHANLNTRPTVKVTVIVPGSLCTVSSTSRYSDTEVDSVSKRIMKHSTSAHQPDVAANVIRVNIGVMPYFGIGTVGKGY